jgi:hypothetical protein
MQTCENNQYSLSFSQDGCQRSQGLWQMLRSEMLAPESLFKSIELQQSSPSRQSWWPVYRWALGWSNPWYRMRIEAASNSIPDLYPSSATVKVAADL